MTREEAAQWSEEFVKECLRNIQNDMAYDMRKGAKKHVYHVEHYYVSIVKGIRFIPDCYKNEDGVLVPYHIVKGLNDEEFYTIKPICDKYNIDETFFDGLQDGDGAVSMSVESIRRQFESESDSEAVRVLDVISSGIVNGELPYKSLHEFSERLSRVRLDDGELYYWDGRKYQSLLELISERGKLYHKARDLTRADWLYYAYNIENYIVG